MSCCNDLQRENQAKEPAKKKSMDCTGLIVYIVHMKSIFLEHNQ